MSRFVLVAEASAAAASTSKRLAKVAAIAEVLGAVDAAEVPVVAGILAGQARQGRIGVGWRTVANLEVAPASEPSLEILDVDATLSALATTTGPGSVAARQALLTDLFAIANSVVILFTHQLFSDLHRLELLFDQLPLFFPSDHLRILDRVAKLLPDPIASRFESYLFGLNFRFLLDCSRVLFCLLDNTRGAAGRRVPFFARTLRAQPNERGSGHCSRNHANQRYN